MDLVLSMGPSSMGLPDVVSAFQDVGDPADLALGVGQLQPRKSDEQPGERRGAGHEAPGWALRGRDDGRPRGVDRGVARG